MNNEDLNQIESRCLDQVAAATSAADVEVVATSVFNKRSALSQIKAGLGQLPMDERRGRGQALNAAWTRIETALDVRRDEMVSAERQQRMAGERIDLSEAPPSRRRGHLHLVTQTRDRLEDVFVGMGFSVSDGPEVETDWYNFEALNFPAGHPARDMYDTLYVEVGEAGSTLLRTHTSPVQIRVMEKQAPPIYTVMPGRCFRQDTADASHLPNFHQIEGLVVDKGITFGDLAGTIESFTRAYFGSEIGSRLRPFHFPFTEPSAELDITCVFCTGSGCKTCSRTGWLELGGCGMMHPQVFRNCGIDPEVWSGFAFGFGIERLAMMRHGVDDMREFVINDMRFLAQF